MLWDFMIPVWNKIWSLPCQRRRSITACALFMPLLWVIRTRTFCSELSADLLIVTVTIRVYNVNPSSICVYVGQNFVITVHADVPRPSDARPLTGTGMTKKLHMLSAKYLWLYTSLQRFCITWRTSAMPENWFPILRQLLYTIIINWDNSFAIDSLIHMNSVFSANLIDIIWF